MTVISDRRDRSRLEHWRIGVLRTIFALQLVPILLLEPVWDMASPMRAMLTAAGTLCVLAAVLGRFWSILYIGGHKNLKVMTDGPYSICRHPLYLFSTIGAFGLGLLLGSVTIALLTGATTLLVLVATAKHEEQHLRRMFGPDYDNYARRVPLLLPALDRFQTPALVTFDAKKLRTNFGDALVFLGFIPFAAIVALLHALAILPAIGVY